MTALGQTNEVVLADFNSDTHLDVLCAGAGLSLSLGNGDGTFGPAQVVPVPQVGQARLAYDVFVHDLDQDGDLDVILPMGKGGQIGFTLIYLGDGLGGLTLQQELETRFSLSSAMEDFNGDNLFDLVILSQSVIGHREIHLRLGDGVGGFGVASQVPGHWEGALAAADLNGDGQMDLVSDVFGHTQSVVVLHGLGNGTFGAPIDLDLPEIPWGVGSKAPPRLIFADVTGDGVLDATITYSSTSIYPGLGGTSFASPVLLSHHASGQALGDLLGNGGLQLVSSTLRDLSVLEFDTSGGFTEVQRTPSTHMGDDVALGDLNQDGRLDVVSVGSAWFSVRLGQPVADSPLRAGASQELTDLGNHPVAADIDLDGIEDLVMLRESDLVTILGDGAGGFQQGMIGAGSSTAYGALAIGDLWGDAHPDAVVAHDRSIRFWQGAGQGQFTPGQVLAVSFDGRAQKCVLTQLDPDPLAEIVLLAGGVNHGYQIKLMDSDGTGGFWGTALIPVVGSARDLDAQDLNGDGWVDLVLAAGASSGELQVYLGTGAHQFAAPVAYPVPGGGAIAISLKDMNGDGFLDAISRQSDGGLFNQISVSLGDGAGHFAAPISQVIGRNGELVVEDFNNDGVLDVAASVHSVVELWVGVGDGSLVQGATHPLGPQPKGLVGMDVNGDDLPDLVSPQSMVSFFGTFPNFSDLSVLTNFANDWATTCGPAAVNSSGNPARIAAQGSTSLQANDLMLTVRGLPTGQFGFFLAARATMVPVPLGTGDGSLCLGGAFYRWLVGANSIQFSSPAGEVSYALDSTVTPAGVTIAPGDTWFFQYWTRDHGGNSNSSNALMVDFVQ